MIKYTKKNFPLYFFIDFIFIALIFYLSYLFKYNTLNSIFTQIKLSDIKEYSFIFAVWVIFITIAFKLKGLYSTDKDLTIPNEIFKVVTAILYTGILIAASIFFIKYKFFSRQIFLESLFLFSIFLSGWRVIKRLVVRKLTAGKLPGLASLIVSLIKLGKAVKERILRRIDGVIRFFLYLLIAVLPFSKAGVEICFTTCLSLWIIKRLLLKRFKPEDSMLNGPIYIYIFLGILSVIGSVYFKTSLLAFFSKFMEGLLLYFIIIEVIRQKRHISIIIGLLLGSAMVVCFDGIIQRFFTGFDLFRREPITRGGITAAFNHKNDLGGYLLVPLSIVVALMLGRLYILKKNWWEVSNKIIAVSLLVLLCLFTITMGLTNSKGAWVALFLGVSVPYLFTNRKIFIGTAISGCLVLSLFFLLAPEPTPAEVQSGAFDIPQASISRMEIWKDALVMIKNRPFFGYGLNTYMQTIAKKHVSRGPTYAHNCYLQMAAEMGIAGLLCFLWIIGRLFSKCIAEVRKHKTAGRFLMIGLLSALSSFLVHSFVDTNLYSLQLNTLFWYMMGLTVCVTRLLQPAAQGQKR